MSWRNAGNEVVIEALCPKDLHQKDVTCNFTTSTLLLEVAGKQVAAGKLSAPIKPAECTWQFGTPSSIATALAGRPTERHLPADGFNDNNWCTQYLRCLLHVRGVRPKFTLHEV
jgi:hypothetical protein